MRERTGFFYTNYFNIIIYALILYNNYVLSFPKLHDTRNNT